VRPEIKYIAIEKNREKYPIKLMCEFFEVSRSGYYAYQKRQCQPPKHETLISLIRQCQKHTYSTYGYRRVGIWLERKGINVNHKAVLRIMQKYGLSAQIRRKRKYRNMGEQMHRYTNILNRDFTALQPNEKWVTDISYIQTEQGTLYLSMIRDLYDNSIVSYKMGTEQTINLVLNTIKDALEKEVVTAKLQLHSDQGFQYTSHGYFTLTQKYGITPSMSRRGNCYDNAMAENFFSILKSECIHRYKPKTFENARLLIDNYIYFYNHQRIQLKTKLTPLEKRRQLVLFNEIL
jgi:putative transposase